MAGEVVRYALSNGGHAIIDKEDLEKVRAFGNWYMNDGGYAVKKTRIAGRNVSVRMHALINATPKGWHTDHINGNKLDNRKANLRTATAQLNAWNVHKEKQHPVYSDLPKGVSFDKNRDQYIAMRVLRKRFDSLEDAIAFQSESVDEL